MLGYLVAAVSWDEAVQSFMVSHRVEWETTVAKVVTWAGSLVVIAPIVLAVAMVLAFVRHEPRTALLLIAGVAAAVLCSDLLKVLVHRPRPPVAQSLVTPTGWSFPSGHAVNAAAAYGLLASLVARTGRIPGVWLATALIVAIVAYTRLYLGVHWLSDVVAGIVLGAGWALITAHVMRRSGARPGDT
jgi:undecaprenyl-diphosphatase